MISCKFSSLIRSFPLNICGNRNLYVASVAQASRKGTRMKRDAKRRANKQEAVKQVFIPLQKRLEMEKVGKLTPRVDDSNRDWPVDNVHRIEDYRWHVHTFEEAIIKHKESLNPSTFNKPNSNVIAHIELSMSADKKGQYMDLYSNIILLPHPYDVRYDRTILAICKDEEMVESIRDLQVTLAVGPEVVKMAEKGNIDFNMYDHIICHSSLLPNLISIRGLLKKKFPSPRTGTAGVDIKPLITRLSEGIQYNVEKDKYDFDFGKVDVKIGTLDMDHVHLEENLKVIINDVENSKPPSRKERAITLVNLRSERTSESYKIDHNVYLPSIIKEEQEKEEMAA